MTGSFGKQQADGLPIGFRLLRLALKLSTMISTEFTGHWANRLWFKSQRFPEPSREKTWLATAQQSTLTHRGRQLAVYSWGEGPTVLLVHGWHGRGAQLGAFAAPLAAAGFRAVAFDAPAHGRTPGTATSLPEVTEALLTVANANLPIHGVITHSFGTAATLHAMTLGLAPQRVAALCAPSSIEFLMDSFAAKLELPTSVMAVHRRLMEARFGSDLWQRFSPAAAALGLQIPALLVHDQEDHDVPFREGQILARVWPGANWYATKGLGHRRILHDPEVVTRVVAFTADTSTPR